LDPAVNFFFPAALRPDNRGRFFSKVPLSFSIMGRRTHPSFSFQGLSLFLEVSVSGFSASSFPSPFPIPTSIISFSPLSRRPGFFLSRAITRRFQYSPFSFILQIEKFYVFFPRRVSFIVLWARFQFFCPSRASTFFFAYITLFFFQSGQARQTSPLCD